MRRSGDLYITSGVTHPNARAQRLAFGLLSKITDGPLHRARRLSALKDLDPARIRLCVAYFHHATDASDLVSALDSFVRSGGALLALHSVSASFKGNALFEELLGGVFTRHDRIAELEVFCSDGGPRRARFVVVDEPYEHRVSPGAMVTCRWRPSGKLETAGEPGEPCAWFREHGRGRVGYLSLGHRSEVWTLPGVEAILRKLIAWCLGGDLE